MNKIKIFLNKWKSPNDQLIGFLFKNDKASYIDVKEIRKELNKIEEIDLRIIINDLKSKGYVDEINSKGDFVDEDLEVTSVLN